MRYGTGDDYCTRRGSGGVRGGTETTLATFVICGGERRGKIGSEFW